MLGVRRRRLTTSNMGAAKASSEAARRTMTSVSDIISRWAHAHEIERDGQQQDGQDVAHHEGQDRLIGPAGTDRRKRKAGGNAADGKRRGEFSYSHTSKAGQKDHGLRDAVGKAAGEDDALVEQTLQLVQGLGPTKRCTNRRAEVSIRP